MTAKFIIDLKTKTAGRYYPTNGLNTFSFPSKASSTGLYTGWGRDSADKSKIKSK